MPKPRARFVALTSLVDALRREHEDVTTLIRDGHVRVDGAVVSNPRARVRRDAAVRVHRPQALRGSRKLAYALDHFGVPVAGRVALDVGASTGGFTTVLLERGAKRVYAVDAGFGQLRGSLRHDPRVVDLERHNVGGLDVNLVPDCIDLVTIDVSYLALADAVPQLEDLRLRATTELIALVKPTYELRRSGPPDDPHDLARAVAHATEGIERVSWRVLDATGSPVLGARGAREFLVHARRAVTDRFRPARS
jgi:23S rRNA (cytidine1920-2'-O)/16S rRNA (cytidine1409-2'-O)-methyltransferase